MTEDYKLPVLYTYSSKSDLKICYVCEEKNDKVQKKLTDLSNRIFADLFSEKLISFLEHSELLMFEKVKLPDTKCVIIINHTLEQYTHYNIPFTFSNYDATELTWLRIFAQLHDCYVRDRKKKSGEFCMKRVYTTETYLMYARNNLAVFAVLENHEV